MENPTKMDDLGIPLFLETPISRKMMNSVSTIPTGKLVFYDHGMEITLPYLMTS